MANQIYYLDYLLQAFIANADFGPLMRSVTLPTGEQQCVVEPGRLQDYLPTITGDGVATEHIVVDLFITYLRHHQLFYKVNNEMFWRPNQEMLDYYFDDILEHLEALEKQQEVIDAEAGRPLRRRLFTDDGLRAPLSQKIAILMKRNNLTQPELAILNNPVLHNNLIADENLLQGHMNCLAEIRRVQRAHERRDALRQRLASRKIPTSSRSTTGRII
jgi:hypothetical protein